MTKRKRASYKDRSKINIQSPDEVRGWTQHLGVSKEQLIRAVGKVGDGAAIVRKELAAPQAASRAQRFRSLYWAITYWS